MNESSGIRPIVLKKISYMLLNIRVRERSFRGVAVRGAGSRTLAALAIFSDLQLNMSMNLHVRKRNRDRERERKRERKRATRQWHIISSRTWSENERCSIASSASLVVLAWIPAPSVRDFFSECDPPFGMWFSQSLKRWNVKKNSTHISWFYSTKKYHMQHIKLSPFLARRTEIVIRIKVTATRRGKSLLEKLRWPPGFISKVLPVFCIRKWWAMTN